MWAQLVCTAVGIWLMVAPQILEYHGPARTMGHILGPLIATFACVALWEATRAVRWVNLPLGGWLVLAPWVLGFSWPATLSSTLAGLLLVLLTPVRGQLRHRFGGGWTMLWHGESRAGERVL